MSTTQIRQLGEELLQTGVIAKSFYASGCCGRECSHLIGEAEALVQVCTPQEFVQKSGVEAISGSHRIDNRHI